MDSNKTPMMIPMMIMGSTRDLKAIDRTTNKKLTLELWAVVMM